jgi:CheY-like chemotaxis protein
MSTTCKRITILIADDDEDVRLMAQEAVEEARLANELHLNMPRKDGREALQEIKADPMLRRIPVVVLTTSKAEEDILRTYDLGVSSFIVKPVSFDSLVEVMKALARYWFEIVELPGKKVGV